MEAKNYWKFIERFITIKRTLQENSAVPYAIRNFVGAHRKYLQSVKPTY